MKKSTATLETVLQLTVLFMLFSAVAVIFLNIFKLSWKSDISTETKQTISKYILSFQYSSLFTLSSIDVSLPKILKNSELNQVPRKEFLYTEEGLRISGYKTNIFLIILDEVLSRRISLRKDVRRLVYYGITPMEIRFEYNKLNKEYVFFIAPSYTIFEYQKVS